jgi:thioredoxin 1
MMHSQRGGIGTGVIIAGLAVLLLVLGGGFYLTQQTPPMEEDKEIMEEQSDSIKTKETVTKAKDQAKQKVPYSGQLLAGATAPLLVFNQVDYEQALSEGKLVVLYFYANWCPTCKAEFPLMENAFDQLDSEEVVGFRVNFNDNETDKDEVAMARKFGVPYQHTKVFVKDGKQLLKSPEEWTTQRYLNEISSRL